MKCDLLFSDQSGGYTFARTTAVGGAVSTGLGNSDYAHRAIADGKK